MQEDSYEAEYLNLKREYDIKYMKLCEDIQNIVTGKNSLPVLQDQSEYEKYQIEKSEITSENGIEDFWYKVVKNSDDFFIVNEKDEKILKHLTEIKLVEREDKLSFTVEFHFSPNDYFTDSVLFKTYNYSIKDQEITDVVSSPINWKSESVKPNKIIKIKKQKSINKNLNFRG